jgi:hypothetical protein
VIAAQSNIHFSHRVLFFLESLNSQDAGINDTVQGILISLCQTQSLGFHMSSQNPSKVNDTELIDVIDQYKKIELLPESTIQKYRNKIKASDIHLGKYNFTMGAVTSLTNDSGYLSTPFFVFSLTNLCDMILKATNREEALFDGLQKINMHLPSAVYVPFVNKSMRNYVVLHIKIMEAKLFVTKMRAPFLICIEVFRPEESKFKDKIEEVDNDSANSDEDEEEDAVFDLELKEKPKDQGN